MINGVHVCGLVTRFDRSCCVVTDKRLQQLVSQFTKNLPPKLIINIKHLRVLESVGQGIYIHLYTTAHLIILLYNNIMLLIDTCITHLCTYITYTGEYGIVYKAQLVRGGLPQLVAVKTVKGNVGCTCVIHTCICNVTFEVMICIIYGNYYVISEGSTYLQHFNIPIPLYTHNSYRIEIEAA